MKYTPMRENRSSSSASIAKYYEMFRCGPGTFLVISHWLIIITVGNDNHEIISQGSLHYNYTSQTLLCLALTSDDLGTEELESEDNQVL